MAKMNDVVRGTRKIGVALLGMFAAGLAGCSNGGGGGNGEGATEPVAPVIVPASTPQGSQTLVGLDPVNNALWVPSYQRHANGSLQYVVIPTSAVIPGSGLDLKQADNPRRITLAGCDTPVGISYAGNAQDFLILCGHRETQQLWLNTVDAATFAVTQLALEGFAWTEGYGGVIFNATTSKALVAGSTTIGLVDVPSNGSPVVNAASITTLPLSVQSMSLNFQTGQAFVTQGTPDISQPFVPPLVVDTATVAEGSATPLAYEPFEVTITGAWNATYAYRYGNGSVFDPATNVLALSRLSDNCGFASACYYYFGHEVHAYNFNDLTFSPGTPETSVTHTLTFSEPLPIDLPVSDYWSPEQDWTVPAGVIGTLYLYPDDVALHEGDVVHPGQQLWAGYGTIPAGAPSPITTTITVIITPEVPPGVDRAVVSGIGRYDFATGRNSGGVTALNATTHQALIADVYGPSLLVMQMPSAPVMGALNNKGQPVLSETSGEFEVATPPDASSVYGLFSGYIPQPYVNNEYRRIGALPNGVAIDQVNNIAYVLADNWQFSYAVTSHPAWTASDDFKLHLAAIDLSNPGAGANNVTSYFMNAEASAAVVEVP